MNLNYPIANFKLIPSAPCCHEMLTFLFEIVACELICNHPQMQDFFSSGDVTSDSANAECSDLWDTV